jgi:hypothetical protein
MLHRCLAVYLWFPCSWRRTPKPPFCWFARDRVGNSRGRGDGKHRSSLCVFFYARIGGRVEDPFPSDAYTNDCFPKQQGEIGALLNLARVLCGFSVAYFQVPWAAKHGALQTFGCEAAYVISLGSPCLSSNAILTSRPLMFQSRCWAVHSHSTDGSAYGKDLEGA